MVRMDFLTNLPQIGAQRIALRVSPSAEKHIRRGHPWLFDKAIIFQNREGNAGDLAVIFDRKRRFLAIGLYDPASPIRVKILQHGTPATIDTDWLIGKISKAWSHRASLHDDLHTNAYRIIHGENDGLPSVILDRYADMYVLKLYSPAWVPWLAQLVEAIEQVIAPQTLILRLSRQFEQENSFGLRDGMLIHGRKPTHPVRFRENGLHFSADVIKGNKTGHFLDQRDNRQRVRHLTAGAHVLDLFTATGGFAVYSAAGGAQSVTAVDINPHALATAEANWHLNTALSSKLTTQVGDVFQVGRKLMRQGRRFDVVIVDPPSFAHKQAQVAKALSAYKRLTSMSLTLVKSGGTLVMASCSSRVSAETFFTIVEQEAQDFGRRLHIIQRTTHPVDHPINFPEGAYLKCLFAELSK